MIVTCAECSTSFQLDEERIPTTGAQVRCSRCKHAFFLAHPSASQTESVHEIAGAAAADPSAGTPAASSDLGSLSSSGLGGSGSTDQSDDEEWQFSEEVRVEGDEEAVREPASDEDSGFGLSEDFGEGLDADSLSQDVSPAQLDSPHTESPPVAGMAAEDDGGGSGLELDGPAAPAASTELVRDESSFGSVDDFSSLMEDDEPNSSSVAAESAAAIESPAESSPGGYAAAGTTDDLGDPESWDLVGGAPASTSTRPAKRKASSVPSTTGAALDGALAELSFTPGEDSLAYDDEREPSAFAALVGRFGHVVGWVVTLAALVGVAGLLVGPEFSRWADAPQTAAFGSLHAETNEMHWMETARSGFVLVMRGEVENTGADAVLPSNVRLWLLDGSGERLTVAPVQVGFPLGEEALREAGQSALRARHEASVNAFVSRPLAPGESRAFEAVVTEEALPKRARRILLEVADPNAEAPVVAGQVNPRSLEALAGAQAEAQAEAKGESSSANVGLADPYASASGTNGSSGRVSDLLELDD